MHTTEMAYAPDAPSFGFFANASFGPKREVDPADKPVDGCVILDAEEVPAAEAKDPPSDNAGTLALDVVLGAKKNALKMEFDAATNQYESLGVDADGVATGAIEIRAAGATVPAFEAEIPALPAVRVLSPTTATKVGARDLAISWSIDDADLQSVVNVSTFTRDVRCYAGKAREVVIPAALMTQLLATDGDVHVMVLTARTVDVTAGDFRIAVSHDASMHIDVQRE